MASRNQLTVDSAPWLEVIEGDAAVLLIAPHGGRASGAARATLHPKVNDVETAAITRDLARRLGAPALINAGMDRNELDCNRLSQLAERVPWFLEMITDRVERMIARHRRATVLLLHGWNIIEPRVDLGLGLREGAGGLRPPAGAHVSASDDFINGPVSQLAAQLRAVKILPSFGLRYPGGDAQNLLQAFTPRHRASTLMSLRRLAAIANERAIDALQLEMSVAVRLPGALRDHNLKALGEIFSRPRNGATPPVTRLTVVREVVKRSIKKVATTVSPDAPPSRVGVEFYDPVARLGGMVSFDFGRGAAGGRIMMLFDRRRVALFTGEGKVQRAGDRLSLGPLILNASAEHGRLEFGGPAVVVDDGSAYLSVERALAHGRLDTAMEVAASLDFDENSPSFSALLARLEIILADAHSAGALPQDAIHAVPPHAAFARLRGTVTVGGSTRTIDAAARIGMSLTGLGPQKFAARRMLWACFPGTIGHDALEARALKLDDAPDHQIARMLRDGFWSECELINVDLEASSPYLPPKQITATLTATAEEVLHGRPDTFMTLSRPGPDGTRIHTSLGFATYRLGHHEGAGMYEYSRRVGDRRPRVQPGDPD
jgi:hypothetical protein